MFTKRNTWLIAIAALATLAITLAACSSDSEDAGPTATPEATSAPEPTAVLTTTPGPAIDTSGVTITMSRGGCFCTSPEYKLTIQGDGSFDFEGFADVGFIGRASDTMPPEDIQRLVSHFDEIGFADFDPSIRCNASDVPTTWTSISRGSGVETSVSTCLLSSSPDSLIALEDLIDEVTNSQRWVNLPYVFISIAGGSYPSADAESCEPLPCRNYKLTIRENGSVEYEGFQNVDVIGTRSGEISEADVLDLAERFEESGFFELPPDFHCQVTDVDATTTTVGLLTRRNSIERCHVDDPSGQLEPLRELELAIAELVGLEQWVGDLA